MNVIKLPEPKYDATMSVEKAIYKRRSLREFKHLPLSIEQTADLLWAGQGTTALGGYRTAPSAGALYPLETYLIAGDVAGLETGVYRYLSREHAIQCLSNKDIRADISQASLTQTWMQDAPAMIALTACPERTTSQFGKKALPFVYMEAGHAAQNIYLEAVSLNLITIGVASLDEEKVRKLMGLKTEEHPLYILPVGRAH